MEVNFDFINFDTQIKFLRERITVLLLGLAAFLLLSLFFPLIRIFQKSWKQLKNELDRSYVAEIFQKNKKLIVKNVLLIFGLAALSVLALVLFINIVSICLPWQDIPSISRNYLSYFHPFLEKIYTLELVSRILFIFAAAIMGFFFINLNIVIIKLYKKKTLHQPHLLVSLFLIIYNDVGSERNTH